MTLRTTGPGQTGAAPATSPAPVPYAQNARRHAADRDAEAGRSKVIARLRLATFLPAAGLLVWGLTGTVRPPQLFAAAALFAVFAVLVVVHARIDERVQWYDARRLVCEQGVARIARDWKGLPAAEVPAGIDITAHPYATDLDLFGRASLFQWIGPAATIVGARTLATWLLESAPAAEILERQDAIAHLAPEDEWRERFAAHGVLASGARDRELDQFLAWAEGPSPFGTRGALLQATVLLLVAAIWVLILLQLTGVVSGAFWLIPTLPGLVMSFASGKLVETTLDRASGGQYALARYAALFEHAVTAPTAGARLSALREQMSAEHAVAPVWMRRLNRILGFGAMRRGAAIFHFPIQALTLWDFHVLFALDRWRRLNGTRVRGWIRALGDLDALATFARVSRDNPSWCLPVIASESVFAAEQLGHPLIAADKRVANDVTVGPPGTLLLVTGSNMSGKSTLLRAIGLNAVLAQAGSCVCALSLRMPQSDLQTSIRIQDSLELGLSYFMAALARLKGVVDAAEHERPGRILLYLLDEILQGTNSAERGIAVRAVARHLLEAGAIGAMTTHDLNLAGEEPLAAAAHLVHFTEIVGDDGGMRFDYQLRPGLATSRNALRLMKLIGIDL